jgi:hypothetical protein
MTESKETLFDLIDFKSNIIPKCQYILSNAQQKWSSFHRANSKICKRIVNIFKHTNIRYIYDNKKNIFLINDVQMQITALLFCSIVIISCFLENISFSPKELFKNKTNKSYVLFLGRNGNYRVNNDEIKHYINLFQEYYQFSNIENKIQQTYPNNMVLLDLVKRLKESVTNLYDEITLKEFDEDTHFLDTILNYRICSPTESGIFLYPIQVDVYSSKNSDVKIPSPSKKIERKLSIDTEMCDKEVSKIYGISENLFLPIYDSPSYFLTRQNSPIY